MRPAKHRMIWKQRAPVRQRLDRCITAPQFGFTGQEPDQFVIAGRCDMLGNEILVDRWFII